MTLVSQKISDLDPVMRSATNVSVFFRTSYERDLRAITRIVGTEMPAAIPKLPGAIACFI